VSKLKKKNGSNNIFISVNVTAVKANIGFIINILGILVKYSMMAVLYERHF
jgi:hypothetical protein